MENLFHFRCRGGIEHILQVGKCFIVSFCICNTLIGDSVNLVYQAVSNHRLKGVKAAVVAPEGNLVSCYHAVIAKQTQLVAQFLGTGDNYATIPPNVKVLKRVQTEAAVAPQEPTDLPSIEARIA